MWGGGPAVVAAARATQLRYRGGTALTVPANTTIRIPFTDIDVDTENYVNTAPFAFPGLGMVPAGQGIRIPAGSPWALMRGFVQGFLDNTQPPNANPGLGFNARIALIFDAAIGSVNGIASSHDDAGRTQDVTFSQMTLAGSGMLLPVSAGGMDIIGVIENSTLVPFNLFGNTWITLEYLTL